MADEGYLEFYIHKDIRGPALYREFEEWWWRHFRYGPTPVAIAIRESGTDRVPGR